VEGLFSSSDQSEPVFEQEDSLFEKINLNTCWALGIFGGSE